jgi:hypothetical protein|tara:strand:+ start:3071 stop:3310 length:240 start_codon:yes stop_codon:yes gene_type:complete
MNENENLKFSDDVISQIAKLVQVAILSGTDIVDNFRQVRLKVDDNVIYLHDDYKEQFDNNIQVMLGELEENSQDENEGE